MSEGSRSPEKPPLVKRKDFIKGLMATIAVGRLGVLGSGLLHSWRRRGRDDQDLQKPPSEVSSFKDKPTDKERETTHQGLVKFKNLLIEKINTSRNLELIQTLEQLGTKEESEIKKNFIFYDRRLSDAFDLGDNLRERMTKDYKFNLMGEYGKDGVVTDIDAFTEMDENGNLLQEKLEFYANLDGRVIGANEETPPKRYSEQELLQIASKVLRNPHSSNLWVVGSGEEGEMREGTISWVSESDEYIEKIYLDETGRVIVTTTLKN